MSNDTRIRERIAEMVGRPKNVTLDEIEWVMNQLQARGYKLTKRKARHGYLWSASDGFVTARFMVNSHNPGSKHVKSYSVGDFADAMMKLGLYDE
jgi:hypothetical protein